MTRSLTLLTPALGEIGIEVSTGTRGSGRNKTRWIEIERTELEGATEEIQGAPSRPSNREPEAE
jgi:hypothetical protein